MARHSSRPATSVRGATATRTEDGLTREPDDAGLDVQAVLMLLCESELEIIGRLRDASNAAFLCRLRPLAGMEAGQGGWTAGAASALACIYKPIAGERPLDDFPQGTLAARERAAFLLSEATGWRIVPPTVLRDGPLGQGMVQLWVDVDPTSDALEMVLQPDPRLRRICVYDVLVNNADRKGSHLLPLPDGHVYGVDHGVCFAVQAKLRTVLWGWRGQPLNDEELEVVESVAAALQGPLGPELGELLRPAEVEATVRRAAGLLHEARFPHPDPGRPAVPWPPF